MAQDLIKPYKGDPFVGHLSTPVSDSALVRDYLSKLPIYRAGLTPLLRGREIGMAHGYFLVGPFTALGPLRDSSNGGLIGFICAVALVLIAKAGMRLYGIATFPKAAKSDDPLQTYKGWADLAKGFMIGGSGGALFAFLLLQTLGFLG
jgi:photosystem I subunit XI